MKALSVQPGMNGTLVLGYSAGSGTAAHMLVSDPPINYNDGEPGCMSLSGFNGAKSHPENFT